MTFALDMIYLALGGASFALTVLYLDACGRL